MHAKSLVFLLSGYGIDMHPEVAIFGRRACMLRRTIALRPDSRSQVVDIYRAYSKLGFFGAFTPGLDLSSLMPIPPHGYEHRQDWKHHYRP
eukprot:12431181-Karenia_brevis.AAC.1